jgi:transposase-like protein
MTGKIPLRFSDPGAARRHLEALRWKDGPICTHCGETGAAKSLNGKSTRPGVYWCNACHKPFTVTVGTIYERSKVPLNLWLYANHLLCNSKRSLSGHQLARKLGVTYKTAWFMARHIRQAMGFTL